VAQGIYSERLVLSSVSDVWADYTVPAGKRAVVRSIVALSGATTPGAVGVVVGPADVLWHTFQATNVTQLWDMRQVAYAGEVISCVITAGAASVVVAGYLFEDASSASSAPGEITHRPYLEVGQR